MVQAGQFHTLPVVRLSDYGAFLEAGQGEQVLLPRRFVADDLAPGDFIRVFLYFDSEDRLVATTETPRAQAGQFASLQVKAVGKFGAFLDWGLSKDLLVPFAEQQRPMETGKYYLVHVYCNAQDGRLVASSRIDRFLDQSRPQYRTGEAVDLVIANSTDLGTKAIVNHQHWGMIFADDLPRPLRLGASLQGYIKRVRADGKIDLMLNQRSERHDGNVDRLWQALERQQGFLPLNDKSDPELIKRQLGMSKASFKRALGSLLKQGRVVQAADGLRRRD